MKKTAPKNDRALRFYNQVLGLDHLHYGIWEPDEELNLPNLKIAQQRYEDLVVSAIPHGVKTILDVGCGTGELSKRLVSMGYEVEGLSPDINQKDLYPEKTGGRPFHFCRFEEFEPEHRYDCIIMSESGQYIPLDRLFTGVAAALEPGGHLVNIDYFVLEGATGELAKSGHPLEAYLAEASRQGFEKDEENDITDATMKTLDLSKQLIERGLIAFDIATEKFRYKRPLISKILGRFLRKTKTKLDQQMVLLDSERFREVKRYILFRFRKQ